jgi:transcriptional regulator with XRE-family HTH domain
MKLSDKIRYLREVEGSLRGLGRAMTQQETVRAIAEAEEAPTVSLKSSKKKPKAKAATISQSYLSQIESGARPHLTNTTRLLLARFFKVHPGYLVDDPEGYHAELMSDVRTLEDKLDLWLIAGAERFRRDSELCHALLTLSRHEDSRRCLLLLESVLETPELVDRLLQVLRPEAPARDGADARGDKGIPQGLKPRASAGP